MNVQKYQIYVGTCARTHMDHTGADASLDINWQQIRGHVRILMNVRNKGVLGCVSMNQAHLDVNVHLDTNLTLMVKHAWTSMNAMNRILAKMENIAKTQREVINAWM